jgi:GTP-binding protein YchF
MGFKCGIVGLPNVGKSTLFNALTQTQNAESANYPFCTIEPNIGIVSVPDQRLEDLAQIAGSAKIIPSFIEFVDIAGLVKGASEGEGLGNKFLGHIREVDSIIHVLRCFEDSNITHVYNDIDPIRDAEIIEAELILSDLESLEKRKKNLEKKVKIGDKDAQEEIILVDDIIILLNQGKQAREIVNGSNEEEVKRLNLLTSKKIMYVCNVSDADIINGNEYTKQVSLKANKENAQLVIVCSKIEEEIANLGSKEDQKEFITSLGLDSSGLDKIIESGFKLLNLSCFFTVGPKEAHSWTFRKGIIAPEAAGIIHSDFEKGFIRAEVISFEDYKKYNGEAGAKESGKLKVEGKSYIVQDGDVMLFRFNV